MRSAQPIKTSTFELIVGRAGTGKTTHCINLFVRGLQSRSAGFDAKACFLVPTLEHAERVRSLVADSEAFDGLLQCQILTLNQLIESYLEEFVKKRGISALYRQGLIADLTTGHSWSYFKSGSAHDAFAERVGDIIAEWKRLGVSPEKVLQLSELRSVPRPLRDKLLELGAVFEKYERALQSQGLWDEEDRWRALLAIESQKSSKSYEAIYLDGFIEFTPQQLAFLEWISQQTDAIYCTLTMGDETEAGDLFSLCTQTEHDLRLLFPNLHRRELTHPSRKYNPELQYLESAVFANPKPPCNFNPEEGSVCRIFAARTPFEEVKLIATEIRRLVQEEQFAFYHICLLFRDVNLYGREIERLFPLFGIPYQIHERVWLRDNYWIRRVLVVLHALGADFDREMLMRYLRLFDATIEERDCYQFEQMLVIFSFEVGKEALEVVLKSESCPLPIVSQCQELFKKQASLDRTESPLFWKQYFLTIFFENRACLRETQGYDREDIAALKRLDEIFDELKQHHPEPISGVRYLEALRRTIQISLFGKSEPNANTVQIYNVTNAKQKEYRILFIGGLSDGSFPSVVMEDALFKDQERSWLAQHGIPLREIATRVHSEKYLFYLAVTRATERLYLFFSDRDDTGQAVLPSSYVYEVQEVLGGQGRMPISRESSWSGDYSFKVLPDRQLQLLRMVSKAPASPLLLQLFRATISDFERLRLIAKKSVDEELHLQTSRQYLAGIKQIYSATALEKFAQCPFKYFAEEGLGLRPEEERLNPKVQGSLTHKVLEKFYRQTTEGLSRKQDWILLRDLGKSRELVEELFDQEARNLSLGETQHETRNQVILRRMRQQLLELIEEEHKAEQTRQTMPTFFELAFGTDEEPFAVTFPNGKAYRFRGSIDRVDLLPEENVAFILDYKGSKTVKTKEIESGRAIQLFLYKMFIEKQKRLRVCGVELYPIRKKRRSGFYLNQFLEAAGFSHAPATRRYSDERLAKFDMLFLEFLQEKIEEIHDGSIRVKPETCKGCQLLAVCRFKKSLVEDEENENDSESDAS